MAIVMIECRCVWMIGKVSMGMENRCHRPSILILVWPTYGDHITEQGGGQLERLFCKLYLRKLPT